MRLSRDDRVAGLLATDARKLMRRFGEGLSEGRIGSLIDMGGRTGTEIARAFEEAGYLRVAVVQDGETYWETTIKGNALAQASLGLPITRATAERHLAGVIARAKRFNADGSHLVDIAELIVFGSYLDPDVRELGDLDLGISFRTRRPDTISIVDWNEIVRTYARANGRPFKNLFDVMSWPEDEARKVLRNRSAAIKITDENVRTLTDRWEVVYSLDAS